MYAQAKENQGIVRLWLDDGAGEGDIEQALAIYRHLKNRNQEVKVLFNLYSIRTSRGDPSAASAVQEIMVLLGTFQINQTVEAGVLGDSGSGYRRRGRPHPISRAAAAIEGVL